MADLNEEQLLTELLRDVSAADTALPGPDLEARVLAAWDAAAAAPKRRRAAVSRVHYAAGIAAMVTLAVVATTWQGPISTPASAPGLASASAAAPLPPSREALRRTGRRDKSVGKPVTSAFAAAPLRRDKSVASASAAAPASAFAATPLPPSREALRRTGRRDKTVDKPVEVEVAESPLEFIPLVPMTERELAGPFQIVRVQMPRASLGRMTSPMHHPSELIEADVLLGEDGMARAIHVSTAGSASPWRPR